MFIQLSQEKYMRFPDGKPKALTFSYDDGVRADERLIEVFIKYGLRGTFNLNSRRFDCPEWHDRLNRKEAQRVYSSCGQEIALHGAVHSFLDKITLPEAVKEVADNRADLEQMFGRIIRGMAYAYGAFNPQVKQVLKQLGVVYARTTASTNGFALPTDFLEWNPTCHHASAELEKLTKKFVEDSPVKQPKHRESWLFYIWGHSFEFDDKNNWDVLEKLGAAVAGREDIWFATNMEIYDYIRAYNALVFSIDGEKVFNPSLQPVWFEWRGKVCVISPGGTANLCL